MVAKIYLGDLIYMPLLFGEGLFGGCMNKTQYQKEVVSEIKRIAKKLGNTITLAQYEKHCQHKYRFELIKYRLESGWNKLKVEAGLVLSSRGGARKAVIRSPKITERECNMCEKPFKAKDNMRSCSGCTNLKNSTSGYAAGFDEMEIGYL